MDSEYRGTMSDLSLCQIKQELASVSKLEARFRLHDMPYKQSTALFTVLQYVAIN